MAKNFFLKLKDVFIDYLFPKDVSCYLCGDEVNEPNKFHLCKKCLNKIEKIKYPCVKCGTSLNSFSTVCDYCKNHKRYFERIYSCVKYDGNAKNLIYKYKFSKNEYIVDSITAFLYEKLLESGLRDQIDYIIPVPISDIKKKKRGFNQTELLAKSLSKISQIKYSDCIIKRILHTPSQIGLGQKEREVNLNKSFRVLNSSLVKGKVFLIVDDVATTGSTINEMALKLKITGAKSVYALTFCHAEEKHIYE